MSDSRRWAALAAALLLTACATQPVRRPAAPAATAGTARSAVLLAINDVYRIEGVEGGKLGGFARLRTLRRELEREHPDLLVLHAGDLLFPSFLSRTFGGEQMIDVLNRLDGDAAAFDPRMFAVFGNHEFEKDKLADAAFLERRVLGSQFRWLDGNVDFGAGADGRPLVAGANLAPSFVVTSGGIRIGIFGLTVDTKRPQYVAGFRDPIATARELSAALRAQGAEVVVALTHLRAATDRDILRQLGQEGPDLILGGHEHEHMACEVGGRFLLKADADARTATVVELRLDGAGRLEVRHRLEGIGPRIAEDPAMEGSVERWLALHEGLFCGQEAGRSGTPADPRCLEKKLGSTGTLLEAEENKIRSRETNLGDWIADRMVETFAGCGAQAAILNSGTLRLNQDLPGGSDILRRHVEELFGYPTPIYQLRLDGRTLERVIEHSIAGWPGAGNWLQVAGLSFVHDTKTGAVSDLRLLGAGGARPIAPDEIVRVVANRYLFDPAIGDRDGYTMLSPAALDPDCALNQKGPDLKSDVVLPALERAGTIAPVADGRIRQRPALADTNPCGEDVAH